MDLFIDYPKMLNVLSFLCYYTILSIILKLRIPMSIKVTLSRDNCAYTRVFNPFKVIKIH